MHMCVYMSPQPVMVASAAHSIHTILVTPPKTNHNSVSDFTLVCMCRGRCHAFTVTLSACIVVLPKTVMQLR